MPRLPRLRNRAIILPLPLNRNMASRPLNRSPAIIRLVHRNIPSKGLPRHRTLASRGRLPKPV